MRAFEITRIAGVRRAAACVLAAGIAAVLLPASSVGAAPRALAVTAFQEQGDPTSLIDRSARALTTVGVDGVSLTSSGATISAAGPDVTNELHRANHDGLRGELLVSNYSDRINDFSEPLGYRLLGNASHRRAVAAALAREVNAQGWDGISVDLESLARRDRAGLTIFLQRLRADLPARATVSICVMAENTPAAYDAAGYDLKAIAGIVDRVVLMTYDDHGPWENTPGPIGPLAWQKRTLHAAEHSVPAHEIDLGIAEYGYAWRPHSNDQLSDAQSRKLAGSHAKWDASVGEWTATLPDHSVLWWSDARSYRVRYAMARSLGLHGVAVWSLGLGDAIR